MNNSPGRRPIVFVGNARCYHTMDWYRSVRRICADRPTMVLTDLVDSEGHVRIVTAGDQLVHLFNVDNLLFKNQSWVGNLWRNAVKLIAVPAQVVGLRRFRRRHPDAVFHAHTMYYMFACWLAGLKFIGTPQGSEVLVRPRRSRIYRYFAIRALRAANVVTVDSVEMKEEARRLAGIECRIFQNGVECDELQRHSRDGARTVVVSLRGMTPLYRIQEILAARERARLAVPITFIYPFWDEAYLDQMRARLMEGDRDLGRLPKQSMYELLGRTKLAISVPSSDSSPRSVYEAIFAGACVAVTEGGWLRALPACMKERVRIVDLGDESWLASALAWAESASTQPYRPSEAAMETFDQLRSMERVVRSLYA